MKGGWVPQKDLVFGFLEVYVVSGDRIDTGIDRSCFFMRDVL